uniref:Uncharacterized protein n=1 Tax=Candidatus Methanogaster sp. ANME-2c ERB4 TaxID=2759911 RepID=A0A7G9Y5F9_9EURY|nr:hypothetical protein CPEMFCDE_00002 [Methanosarcinales archaeon ANME-2c ERB4]QNO45448.1 hypothetical protein HCBNPDKA_00002 [Methanosarcinales archaeon ANME-2c ERB4]
MGAIEHPQATQGVFNKIADNPVRCEQLCGSRNVLLADLDVLFQVLEHLLLHSGDIILVYPPDDLNFLPIILINDTIQIPKDEIGMQEPLRKQQFSIILNILKQERHDLMHVIAQVKDEIPVQLFVLTL